MFVLRMPAGLVQGMTRASTRQGTVAGAISVSWHIDGDQFLLDAQLPPGTAAQVKLLDRTVRAVSGVTCRISCNAITTHEDP
jgi:hypothetical protein